MVKYGLGLFTLKFLDNVFERYEIEVRTDYWVENISNENDYLLFISIT